MTGYSILFAAVACVLFAKVAIELGLAVMDYLNRYGDDL